MARWLVCGIRYVKSNGTEAVIPIPSSYLTGEVNDPDSMIVVRAIERYGSDVGIPTAKRVFIDESGIC
jgi:hypothetical protein